MVVKGQKGYPSIPAVIRIMKIYKTNLEEKLDNVILEIKDLKERQKLMAGDLQDIRNRLIEVKNSVDKMVR